MEQNDKRLTKLTPLPLVFDKSDKKDFIKQHWNITFARQKKISIYSKRIIANVLAMIRDDEFGFRPYYQMHVSSVIANASHEVQSSYYSKIKKAFDELTDLKWYIEDLETNRFSYRHLFDTTKSLEVDGRECCYMNGQIMIILNPALMPYFIEVAHYTTFELKHYMHLKSWYSMRLFELLSAFRDTGLWEVSIEDFRSLMDCEKKYPKTTDLLKYTLSEPLNELTTTNLAFSYEPIFEENLILKGRRPISGLRFRLQQVELKKIPQEWYTLSDKFKKVCEKLLKFKVSESNITRYAKIIGEQGANKLIREWEIKQNSSDRINDLVKYCNAAWVREGKERIRKNGEKTS
jgi:plasmid replication initiation protein